MLDSQDCLVSDLWVDQPDAHRHLAGLLEQKQINDEEAANLASFIDQGYLVFPLREAVSIIDQADAEVDRLWREKPFDLPVAPGGKGLRSFRDVTEEEVRTPGYRIADPHSHSPVFRQLYLCPEIFRYVELILRQPAVAFQSLYFQWGSQQGLHRDPMFVRTNPPSHLLAAWIALEDITPECGPLRYVPGSHRLPWYQFRPGDIVGLGEQAAAKMGDFDRFMQEACEQAGLQVRSLTCKRGDVLIWHAGLLHGGEPIVDTSQTRKSFVVHFCSARNYGGRKNRMRLRNKRGEWVPASAHSSRRMSENGCTGVQNPFRVESAWQRSWMPWYWRCLASLSKLRR